MLIRSPAGLRFASRRVLPLVFRVLALALPMQAATMAHAAETTLANGVFLVAKPELRDPNFSQSVVLITLPRADRGPLGVIINRPLGRRFSELMPEAVNVPEKSDPIFFGGPVARTSLLLLVRAKEPPERSFHVLADLYLVTSPELIERLVKGQPLPGEARIYAGYAGWTPGQLQNEIARGSWYVTNADVDTIFASDPVVIWPQLIKRLGTRNTGLTPLLRARDSGGHYLDVPQFAVFEYPFVARDDDGVFQARGCHQKAVRRVGVEVAGQRAAFDGDFRLQPHQHEPRAVERRFNPLVHRHSQADAAFGCQQRDFPN